MVWIARTMSQNSADDSVKILLFLENACAIEEYKWERRWNTQLAPLARRASFPVSFWASDTLRVPSRVEQLENLLKVFERDGNCESVGVDDESQHGLLWIDH